MKTFKFSLVALAATALFTACSNDEAVQPVNGEEQAISFRIQGGTPEITTRTTATTALYVDAFVVWGTDDKATAAGTTIFDGVTVARRQVDGLFDYNPKRYYGIGATSASFFAYSPVSANVSAFTGVAPVLASPGFKYGVKAPDPAGNTAQEDLLVAGTNLAPSPTVNLNFEHALSRIFVKATNGLKEDVVITGLKLINLFSEGTMASTPGSPWAWAWTPTPGSKIDYDYVLAQSGVAVKAGVNTATLVTSMEQGMMVLPQVTQNTSNDKVVDTGDFALEVTYDVANLTNQTAHILLKDGFDFLMGKQYAITINFKGIGLVEISFTVTMSNFTDDIVTNPTNP